MKQGDFSSWTPVADFSRVALEADSASLILNFLACELGGVIKNPAGQGFVETALSPEHCLARARPWVPSRAPPKTNR